MELTPIEKDLLQIIQRYFPNSWGEVLNAYLGTKSFDDTIKILEYARSHGMDIFGVLSVVGKQATDPKDTLLKACEELRLSVAQAGYVCDVEDGNTEGAKMWMDRIKLHTKNLEQWKQNKPIGKKSWPISDQGGH